MKGMWVSQSAAHLGVWLKLCWGMALFRGEATSLQDNNDDDDDDPGAGTVTGWPFSSRTDCQQLWLIPTVQSHYCHDRGSNKKNTTTKKVHLQITSCQFKCHECAKYNTKQWWTVTTYIYWSTSVQIWGISTVTIYICSTCYYTA